MKKVLSLLLATVFILSSFILSSCEIIEALNGSNKTEVETKTYYIPVKVTSSTADGIYSIAFELGENNLPSKRIDTDDNGKSSTVEYTYDSGNNLIHIVYKDHNGEVTSTAEYTNDSNGLRIKSVMKDKDGRTDFAIENEYNSKGQLVVSNITAVGSQVSKNMYSYDDKGDLIKETAISHYGDISVWNYTYTYDANGNLTEKTCNDQNYSYTYDSNGNLLKATCPNPAIGYDHGKYITYDVAYDENGNLTTVIVTDSNNEKTTYTVEYKAVTVPKDTNTDSKIGINALIEEMILLFSHMKVN